MNLCQEHKDPTISMYKDLGLEGPSALKMASKVHSEECYEVDLGWKDSGLTATM